MQKTGTDTRRDKDTLHNFFISGYIKHWSNILCFIATTHRPNYLKYGQGQKG